MAKDNVDGDITKKIKTKSTVDTSKEGVVAYLSSSLFPGVGLMCAEKIFNALGENALEIIENNPSVLDDIKGVTKNQKQTIYTKIIENRLVDKIFVKLYQIGLTSKMVMKLYEKYGLDTLEIIEENPF